MATGERTDQKQRTRQDLLKAAVRLMKQGRVPKLAEVAEEAMVSRATAYRYFSSDEALITEAAIHGQTPTAEHLFADDKVLDPEERLSKANAVLHDVIWGNQLQMRLLLARLLDHAAGATKGQPELRRQNRRTEFIQTALAPARNRFDKATYRKLCAALALVFGVESMIVFRDVLQIDEPEAREVENWTIRALTQAALLESRTKSRKPLRSIPQRDTKKRTAG
jgi:AcrR family transcriptional regulator